MVGQLEGDPDALVVIGSPLGRLFVPHRGLAAVVAQQPDEKLLGGGLARAAGT
ncbi:Uncharacterised protein [Mycobacterium tuberculosis]|nr:Uncharacterised protein [Mycobacterium tuberculosis]